MTSDPLIVVIPLLTIITDQLEALFSSHSISHTGMSVIISDHMFCLMMA